MDTQQSEHEAVFAAEVEFLSFGQPQLTGVTFLNQSISESEVQGFHPEQRADYPCWLSLHESYPKPCSLPTGYTNKLETTVFLEETFLAVKPVILQVSTPPKFSPCSADLAFDTCDET